MASVNVRIESQSLWSVSYGSMTAHRCVLPKSAKISAIRTSRSDIPGITHRYRPFDIYDGQFVRKQDDILVDTPFMKAFYALFDLLPIETKLSFMPKTFPFQWQTVLMGKIQLPELSHVSVRHEIGRELLLGQDMAMPTCKRIELFIEQNVKTFQPFAGEIIGAFDVVLDNSFKTAFPKCCSSRRMMRARRQVKACRDRIKGFLNPPKETETTEIHISHVFEEDFISYPAAERQDMHILSDDEEIERIKRLQRVKAQPADMDCRNPIQIDVLQICKDLQVTARSEFFSRLQRGGTVAYIPRIQEPSSRLAIAPEPSSHLPPRKRLSVRELKPIFTSEISSRTRVESQVDDFVGPPAVVEDWQD